MRTLRYLGVLAKTGLRGIEADELLEKVKSMPEVLGNQEKVFLSQYGFSFIELKEYSRDEVLDMFKGLGKNLYISEKTRFIKDDTKRRKKVKELILRLRNKKVIFNLDVDDVTGIVSKFSKFRIYNEVGGFGKYCNSIEEKGLKIESKHVDGEEYFVVTKIE